MNPKLLQSLNEQMNHEFQSAYLYLSMSAYCDLTVFKGAAKWLHLQAKEELGHAHKFYDYLLSRGVDLELLAIPKPQEDFESLLDVFEIAYASEQKTTASIHALLKLARASEDPATEAFLQYFVTEQVEEEGACAYIVGKLQQGNNQASLLFMIDHELSERKAE